MHGSNAQWRSGNGAVGIPASLTGPATVSDFSVSKALAGKRILFTGATGFVGKVALSMLLVRFPEIGKVYVLARPGVSTGAEDRFYGKVVPAPPFDPLRAIHGPDTEKFLREKCDPIPGDVSKEWCGFSPELLARLEGNVDVLVNCAGLVDFNPTLEAALNANAYGAIYVAKTAQRLGAKLVHVSTCFVAGSAPGIVPEDEDLVGYFPKREEWKGQTFDPFVEVEDCKKTIDRLKAEADDRALQSEFRAKAVERLHDEGRDEHDDKAVRTGAARERKLWVGERLIRAGVDRSQHWGWPNTYCYTKSLGDQLIDGISRQAEAKGEKPLEFAIVRPAIVESALRFPFPGWNEGFTTTAPLTFLALKGHRAYPGRDGLVLDVIPADHIAAGLIAVTAAILESKARKVYQLGTSDSNPLRMERSIELTGLYRRRYFLKKAGEESKLKNELLARIEPQVVSKDAYLDRSAPQISKLAKRAVRLIDDVKPRWGGPRIAASLERVQDELESLSKRADMAHMLFDLFIPFVWENSYTFQSKNIRALYERMDPVDAAKIPWDPDGYDWLHYWLDVHLPGLEKWVYPNLEDEFGVKTRKKGLPVYRDIWELLEARSRRHPGKVAMRFLREDGDDRYTYGQLRDRSVRAAFYLQAKGVAREDRVLILGENRPEWAMAYFGIVKAGGTAVPVDYQSTLEEIENVARSAGASAVILSDKVRERLELEGQTKLGDSMLLGLQELFQGQLPAAPASAMTSRDPVDLASLIFTSGTTGKPKGVMLTGRNFTSLVSKLGGVFDLGERDGLLSVLPMHHTFEFTTGLLVPLAAGSEIAYLEELSGDTLAKAFETGRITAMVGVPALWQLLLRRIEGQLADAGLSKPAEALQELGRRVAEKQDLVNVGKAIFFPVHKKLGGRLRYLISGGSAMPPDVYNAYKGMGFSIFEGYGLTEAAPVLTVQAPGDAQAGHVGKALAGVEVKIHEPDPDGVGEVIAKGPNVMAGYWNDPEATSAVIKDGWLYTGDLGKLDSDGHLVIVGRRKDVIIDANGKNVYPDELEDLYRDHPMLKELSVVGLPDDGGGEKVACLAVPDYAKGAHDEVRQQVEAHFREVSLRLPYYKRVKVLHLVDKDLPKTATRKVKRKQVVDELLKLERAGKAFGGKRAAVGEGDAWLYELVARVCEQPRDKVTPEARLEKDLGFDSLMFTELGVALESAGVKLPAPEEVMSIATVADLARQVGVWKRGGGKREERTTLSPKIEAKRARRERERSLFSSVLDVLQPTIDKVPMLGSAVALARAEGLKLEAPEPVRKAAKKAKEVAKEAEAFELPEPMVAAGRGLLRSGQRSLYDALFDVKVYGRANVPSHTNFLVAANHASHLDMGLVKHALGDAGDLLVALAARDYFFSDRWRRTYFENFTNLIPMDRHGSLRESLKLASKSISLGKNLLIFPEGTRATDGKIHEFKASLGYLALSNKVGILPVYLKGTHEALPKGAVVPATRDLSAHIGPFLSYEELSRRTQGLPRSEQHREVARIVEEAVRVLASERPRQKMKPAKDRPARTTIDVTPDAKAEPAEKHGKGKHQGKHKGSAEGEA